MKSLIVIFFILFTNLSWANCSTYDNKIFKYCDKYQSKLEVQKAFSIDDPNDLLEKFNLGSETLNRAYEKGNLKLEVSNNIKHLFPFAKSETSFVFIDFESGKNKVSAIYETNINAPLFISFIAVIIATIINSSLPLRDYIAKTTKEDLGVAFKHSDIKKSWFTSPLIIGLVLGLLIAYFFSAAISIILGFSIGVFCSLFGFRVVNKQSALWSILCGGFITGFMTYVVDRIFSESGLFSVIFIEFVIVWIFLIVVDVFSTKFKLAAENTY